MSRNKTSLYIFCFLLSFLGHRQLANASDILKVTHISIDGNNKTRPKVILRELAFQVGDTILRESLQKTIERSEQNVYNLRLFNLVKIQTEILGEDLYCFITVKERFYIFPFPQIKPEERNAYDFVDAVRSGDFHRFSYGLRLRWRNITGRNEWLDFYGQLGFTNRLRIGLVVPGILGKPYLDMFFNVRYIEENEFIYGTENGQVLYLEREEGQDQRTYFASFGLRKRFSIYESLTMSLSYEHVKLSSGIYDFNERFITRDNGEEYYPRVLLSYVNDHRDYLRFPSTGYKAQVMFAYTGFPNFSTSQYAKMGVSWVQHLPLSRRWNFSYGIQEIASIGRRIPFYAKNFLGIRRSEFPNVNADIRGYEPYAVDGSFIHLIKTELKFALIPRRTIHIKQIPLKKFQDMPFGVFLTGFSDSGYVIDNTFSNSDNYLKNKLLVGYGVGLNLLIFYDFLFRIEVSRNHLGETGLFFSGGIPIR